MLLLYLLFSFLFLIENQIHTKYPGIAYDDDKDCMQRFHSLAEQELSRYRLLSREEYVCVLFFLETLKLFLGLTVSYKCVKNEVTSTQKNNSFFVALNMENALELKPLPSLHVKFDLVLLSFLVDETLKPTADAKFIPFFTSSFPEVFCVSNHVLFSKLHQETKRIRLNERFK